MNGVEHPAAGTITTLDAFWRTQTMGLRLGTEIIVVGASTGSCHSRTDTYHSEPPTGYPSEVATYRRELRASYKWKPVMGLIYCFNSR
jgi:hypothetical protein